MARPRTTFAPTSRAFIDEAGHAGNRYALDGRRELNQIDTFVREVRRHIATYVTGRKGQRHCTCDGPRECLLRIEEALLVVEQRERPRDR